MGERLRRIVAWPDAFTAAAIVLILAGLLEATLWPSEGVDSDTFKALTLSATVPLLASRQRLALCAIIVGAATVTLLSISGRPSICVLIGQYWILYLVASRNSRAWIGVALLPLIGNAVYPYSGNDEVLSAVLFLGGGVLVAALGDTRRQAQHAIAERNAAREETAQARHDRAVLAERSRIARELHDVVAHHVSMMVVQAETARVGTAGLNQEGSKSLEVIRDTGRQALSEMRRVVGVLRRDPDPGEPITPADRSPQPSLDRVDDLIAAARAAGTPVTLQRDVRVPALPAMVELCGYRIIQEALTNVRRHAPGAAAEVVVQFSHTALHIRVTDNGPGSDPVARQGHGLVGMRERAAMVGGRLWAGPLATGGFLVEAELPTYGMPPTSAAQTETARPEHTPPETARAEHTPPETARPEHTRPKPAGQATAGQETASGRSAPGGTAASRTAPHQTAPQEGAWPEADAGRALQQDGIP